ncbi:FAD-linked oxidase C-terminal domain-containing protein [Escherichia coli]
MKAGATDVRLAQDEAERVRFWAGRKNAFPAVGRISRITTASIAHPASRPAWRTGRHCPFIAAI